MNTIKHCENCGTENTENRYFCIQCGKLLEPQRFSNKELYKTAEIKILRIIENLQHTPHIPILWNDTADAYTQKVEQYFAMLDLPELKNERTQNLQMQMTDLLNLCQKPEFQIAFVGTIKTGKSTLINALLGRNYASMDVTPETAALTKFRSNPKDYIRIIFYSSQEWCDLWASRTSGADAFMKEYKELDAEKERKKWVGHSPIYQELANSQIKNALQIWSSSKRAEHYFVKEIEVGISSLPKDFPPQVVFVDTPGLSDPVAYRSEITRQYIRRANAVFVCVDAQKMYKEEIDTISSVFSFSSHNKSKVHIIATHWDMLNKPKEDWRKQKIWMKKQLTGKGFFPDEEMAETNIMYASAYIYNLCRDFEQLSDGERFPPLMKFAISGGFPFMPDEIKNELEQFMKVTNIDRIKSILIEKLASQYNKLLMEEIKEKYRHIIVNLKRFAVENRNTQCEFISATEASIQEMESKIEKQRKNFEEISQCSQQLTAVLRTVEKNTEKRLSETLSIINKLVNSKKW